MGFEVEGNKTFLYYRQEGNAVQVLTLLGFCSELKLQYCVER